MKILYKISFYSYWQVGSGMSKGTETDSVVLKDDNDLPYIPGRTIKGLLKEIAHILFPNDSEFINYFGRHPEDDKKTLSGTARFGDAELDAKTVSGIKDNNLSSQLYESKTYTALDENKQAEDFSLRTEEVVIPLELFGSIYKIEPGDIEKFKQCFSMLKRLGVKRNRGMGRLKIEFCQGEEESVPLKKEIINSNNERLVQTYKCILNSHLLLTHKTKTEVNLDSLDYIPGNVFRGLAIEQLNLPWNSKKNEDKIKILDIVFNGTLRFGDAHIAINKKRGKRIPAVFFYKKSDTEENMINVNRIVKEPENNLKQIRGGFFIFEKDNIKSCKPEFGVQMKSEHDSETRSSKEGNLFIYKYLKKNQEFIFDIEFDNVTYAAEIKNLLCGNHFIGKSKSAQFGDVFIELIEEKQVEMIEEKQVEMKDSQNSENSENEDELAVYAESNLCFVNKYGDFTWKPSAEDFGLSGGSKINYEKSKVLFDRYFPWNAHRNTWDAERLIIKKGSVFIFEKAEITDSNKFQRGAGVFLSEGFGKISANPDFLKVEKNEITKALHEQKNFDDEISNIDFKVNEFIKDKSPIFKGIKPSQWGSIYKFAEQANTDDELNLLLFDENTGFLQKGMLKTEWSKKNRLQELQDFIKPGKLQIMLIKKLSKQMQKSE